MTKTDYIEMHKTRKNRILMQHVNDTDVQSWHTRRLLGIGGSEVAAVLGLNPYGTTPFDVWQEKTGRQHKEISNRFTLWGSILEDTVARHFAYVTGYAVAKCSRHFSLKSAPWLVGNVDRLITIDGVRSAVLECKTASAYSDSKFNKSAAWYADGEFFDDNAGGITSETDIPINYYLQCQHYMLVTGYHKCFLAVLIGGNDYRIFVVPFNESVSKFIYSKCSEFWCQNVLSDVPPEPKSSDYIKTFFQKENSVIVANDYVSALIATMKVNNDKIAELEHDNDLIKDEIVKYIATNEQLLDADGNKIATFKAQNRSEIDFDSMTESEKKICTSYDEIIKKHTIKKQSEKRTLRFSSAKKKDK